MRGARLLMALLSFPVLIPGRVHADTDGAFPPSHDYGEPPEESESAPSPVIDHPYRAPPRPEKRLPAIPPAVPVEVSESGFRDRVLKSKLPVLVLFHSKSCSDRRCREFMDYAKIQARNYDGRAKVFTVDVDRSVRLKEQYRTLPPEFILFKQGEPVFRTDSLHRDPHFLRRLL